MKTIDKIYGTRKDWDQIHRWLSQNVPVILNQLYDRPEDDCSVKEIANFDAATEQFLLYHCSLNFLKSKIRKKYGIFDKSFRYKAATNNLERAIQKHKLYEE